jgi:hypothetical protein
VTEEERGTWRVTVPSASWCRKRRSAACPSPYTSPRSRVQHPLHCHTSRPSPKSAGKSWRVKLISPRQVMKGQNERCDDTRPGQFRRQLIAIHARKDVTVLPPRKDQRRKVCDNALEAPSSRRCKLLLRPFRTSLHANKARRVSFRRHLLPERGSMRGASVSAPNPRMGISFPSFS